MKKIFRSAWLSLAVTAMSIATLTSCGGSENIEKVIPADIDWAVKIDLGQLIQNAGGSIDSNGKITLPEQFASQPMVTAMAQPVIELVEPFNLSNCIVFERTNNECVMVAQIRDVDKAKEQLEKYLPAPEKKDGFTVYTFRGVGSIAIKGSFLYAAESFDEIKSATDAAETSSLNEYTSIQQWINSPNFIAVVASPTELQLPANYSSYWLCASLNLNGPTMSGEIIMMDKDGKRYPFGEAFGEVSTDFLRYIPDRAQTVMALGKIESAEIKSTISSIAAQLGAEGQLLTNLDGTEAFALSLSPDFDSQKFVKDMQRGIINIDPDDITFLGMVHYPDSTISYLTQMISDSAVQQGQIPAKEPNGLYSVKLDGCDYHYGNTDGYFAIANYPILPNSENEYTTLVSGTRGVIASIQEPGANPYGFTWGSKGRIWLTTDAIKGEATITNTSKTFLETLFEALSNPQVQNQIEAAIESSVGQLTDSSFGGFDDDSQFFVTQ